MNYAFNVVLNMVNAPRNRQLLQVRCYQLSVKVPCVPCDSFSRQCSRCAFEIEKFRFNKTRVIYWYRVSVQSLESPVMRKRNVIAIGYKTERMVKVIFSSGCRVCLPIDELHCAFETGVAVAHPFLFRNTEEVKEHRL